MLEGPTVIAVDPLAGLALMSWTIWHFGPQVDGDSSTNDTLLALASGEAGGSKIGSLDSAEAQQLQAALDAVRPPLSLNL